VGLLKLLREIFPGLPETVQIKYQDEDDDMITLSSDIELSEAFHVALKRNPPLLRLFIFNTPRPDELPRSAPASQPAPSPSASASSSNPKPTPSPNPNPNPTPNPTPTANPFGGLNLNDHFSTLQGAGAGAGGEADLSQLFQRLGLGDVGSVLQNPDPERVQALVQQALTQLPQLLQYLPQLTQYLPQLLAMLSSLNQSAAGSPSPSPSPSAAPAPSPSPSPATHPNVRCDGCSGPVVGIRWKCSLCPDYDLCEKCEARGDLHPREHALLRIERPAGAHPFASLLPHLFRGVRGGCPYSRAAPTPSASSPSTSSTSSARFSARFVQERHEEDTQEPGDRFVKIIRLRNDGSEAWPENCQLVCVEGASLAANECVIIPSAVAAGQETAVAIDMRAPQEAGRYVSHWRLVSPDGHRFGERITIEYDVIPEPEQEEMEVECCAAIPADPVSIPVAAVPEPVPSPVPAPVPSAPAAPAAVTEAVPISLAPPAIAPPAVTEAVPISLAPPVITPSAPAVAESVVTPPAQAQSAPAATTSFSASQLAIAAAHQSHIESQLSQLESMGFTEREVNRQLLMINGGDLVLTVQQLLENVGH
jgi:next-to-BRCA1 protein 1